MLGVNPNIRNGTKLPYPLRDQRSQELAQRCATAFRQGDYRDLDLEQEAENGGNQSDGAKRLNCRQSV